MYTKDGNEVSTSEDEIIVQPNIVQAYIYLEFKQTTGDYEEAPSSTTKYTISYNNGSPTVNHSSTTNVLTDNTTTYTFTDKNLGSTTITYTIPSVYTLTDNKETSEDRTTITVTPIVEQTYMIIQFLPTVGSLTVNPSVEKIRVDYIASGEYNITPEFINNGLSGHALSYKYNGAKKSVYTITAENAIHTYKTTAIEQTETLITVTPEMQQEYMFLEFNPTTGDLEKEVTSGVTKFLIAKTNWSTNLSCDNITFVTIDDITSGTLSYSFADYASTATTVEYTGIENIYTLYDEGITSNDTTITVTPELAWTYVNVEFKETKINTRICDPSSFNTFLINKDYATSLIEETEYTETESKITFTGVKDTTTINLVYYLKIEPIYTFTTTAISETISPSGRVHTITVTPQLVQTYIYVEFNEIEKNSETFTPSETNKFMIEYKSGEYKVEYSFTDKGIDDSTLTYTLNEEEKEVTYTIPAAYTLSDAGITREQEIVTITPEVSQVYIVITFKTTTIGADTISPKVDDVIGEITLKVLYNAGNYISYGEYDWANSTLSYEVQLVDGSVETISYVLAGYAPYTFDETATIVTKNGKNEEIESFTVKISPYTIEEESEGKCLPQSVPKIEITQNLVTKKYDIGFG